MQLETQIECRDSTLFIRIHGLMDYSTIDRFHVDIPENITCIVMDFAELDFIDSTGIGSVLSIIYTAGERGLRVELQGLTDETRELFDTVGVFTILETLLKGRG